LSPLLISPAQTVTHEIKEPLVNTVPRSEGKRVVRSIEFKSRYN